MVVCMSARKIRVYYGFLFIVVKDVEKMWAPSCAREGRRVFI